MTDATSGNKEENHGGPAGPMPLPDPNETFADQQRVVLLAMCLFGEARGESDEARRAIAQVVINRARNPHKVFGSQAGSKLEENLRRVILKPRQFSCFLEGDPNYPKIFRPLDYEMPAVWQRCLESARQALAHRDEPDTLTLNSDHYFDDSLQPPTWADPAKQTVLIGRLRFYRLYLPQPTAGAAFRLHIGADDGSLPNPMAAGDAAATPSRRESSPPETSRRADAALPRASEGGPTARHRREGSGSGSHASHPAPHHPSQRTPRLGPNRWYQRSRGLSSLSVCEPANGRMHSNRLLAVALLSLSMVACTEIEKKAYQTLARTEVEYENVHGWMIESALHGLLDDQQVDRYIAASHSFAEAHRSAVEAFAAWIASRSAADRARLETSLEVLPQHIQELNNLVKEFDRHSSPSEDAPDEERETTQDTFHSGDRPRPWRDRSLAGTTNAEDWFAGRTTTP